ncbi:MAG: glycosyltransferase family 2 protein, partial [Chlamydiae bacterium]|nr:glycosyltransferase family 2 protein [Chlamydiota bacterium]
MKKNLGIFLLLSFLFHQCSNGSTLNLAKKVEEPKTNLPFVIVTPSYNNSSYVGKNLQSIFSQDYNNYRLIYIDDASTDTTYEDVKNIIEEKGVIQKVELIRNEKNQKALYNLYKAIHSCKDEEIVIILDGDDWFSNDHVLSDLNKYYANKNVWMTYGQYMRHPDSQIGLCQAVSMEFLKNANMRKGPWYYSHLRTFYAGLFKKIRLEDLSQDGQFFPVTYDLAIMFPMLEMARTHAFFTPEVFYVYNWENPTCDQKIREKEQLAVEAYLRGKTVYSPLKLHPAKNEQKNACDLVVFSFNRPLQLFALLESTELHVKGMRKIAVLMRSDEEFIEGYNKVKERFPYVHFVEQPKINTRESFKPILLDLLFGKFGKDAN